MTARSLCVPTSVSRSRRGSCGKARDDAASSAAMRVARGRRDGLSKNDVSDGAPGRFGLNRFTARS
jgi:hypothetical protein